MGIPLTVRLGDVCPKSATSCVVWLDGYWGTTFFDLREGDKWQFGVVKVHGLVTEQVEPNQEIKVFIESPSP